MALRYSARASARRPVRLQRLHELLGEALVQRVGAGGGPDLGERLAVPPAPEFQVEDALDGAQPVLFEPGHFVAVQQVGGDIAEKGRLPERERGTQQRQLFFLISGGICQNE